jgi:hypothetical protein
MDFDPFHAAVQQAKVILGKKRWDALNFCAQSAMIYQQLRLIDAELVGAPLARKNNASALHRPSGPTWSPGFEQVRRSRQKVEA